LAGTLHTTRRYKTTLIQNFTEQNYDALIICTNDTHHSTAASE